MKNRPEAEEAESYLEVFGAREHNLKNIDVRIPRNKLVVITGLSGSGKSSLAFETIYAEGQRRYMESFSAYARQFIGDMERPDVDKIEGLSPVISIEQKTTGRNPRSTVGTITEVYDFMRLLFARVGEAYSYVNGKRMQRFTEQQIESGIAERYAGKKIAFCDQAEPAKAGKLVRRALTRILSPGTTLAPGQLDAARNHYLCALSLDRVGLHAAWLDLSTGEFKVATEARAENLLPVLTALDPAELLVVEGAVEAWKSAPHEQTALHALHRFAAGRLISELPAYHFETAAGARAVLAALGVLNLEGFGLAPSHLGLGPAGALVYYATENLCANPENLRGLQEDRSARTLTDRTLARRAHA